MKRTDFVVDAALQVAHIDPTLLLLYLRVIVQNLVSKPRQVIHPQLVLFSCRTKRDKENGFIKVFLQ